jgi:AcrR family transcriptional regulator
MARELSTEKQQAFLNAALKLFAAKGIQNTSTAEIAKEAGTAAGTLFLYFATKQDLIDAVAIMVCRQEAEFINRLLNPDLSVHDTFFAIWDGSVRWLLENPDAYTYSQQTREPGLVTEAASMETAKCFQFYYVAIQRGLEEGLLKGYPIDLIGGFLYQDIVATINHLLNHPDPARLGEIIQQGFELFWDGIRIK